MKGINIVEKKVDFEKEAKLILKETNGFDDMDKACFFYFFVKNNYLFNTYLKNINIVDLIVETEDSITRDFNLEYPAHVKNAISSVFCNFIKDNRGTCANYFGTITLLLTLDFLNGKYNELFQESDFYLDDNRLNNSPIDIICEKKVYDFVESKFTIEANVAEIQTKLEELINILANLDDDLRGKPFLSTVDFKLKKKIAFEIEYSLPEGQIINSEDLFKVKPTP